MKRILLVVGAKGMLGRDLLEVLHSSFPDDEVIGWDVEEIDIQRERRRPLKSKDFDRISWSISPPIPMWMGVIGQREGFSCECGRDEGCGPCGRGGRAKMVYLSTDYVFDGNKEDPYLENDSPDPLNVYGRSKWRGERYVQELAKGALIIRTQWLYGKYGKNFVSSVLRQGREKKVLSIVNDQTGSPTYTVDLSKAMSTLIQSDGQGIFHVANQ